MGRVVQKQDAALAGVLLPICNFIPVEAVSSSAYYQQLVAMVPNELSWALASFSMALWLFYPWGGTPRLHKIWTRLTDKFEVVHLHAGQWHDDLMGITPETDIAARLRLRFVRSGRFKLRLRLYACTGQGQAPYHHVINLGARDAIVGEVLTIPLVDMGIPAPGWDHERKRGWGPDREPSLIGRSKNVVTLECEGRVFTQRHRIFVEMVNHDTGRRKFTPSIYLQEEGDDIWDVTADSRVGLWKW